MKKAISLILAVMLTFSLIFVVSCNEPEVEGIWKNATYSENTELGQGGYTFTFEVAADGTSITLTVHTDKTVLGDALTELGLISGDMESFGLYVKYVNGMYADYNETGKYWALYIDGEYAMSGVDSIPVTEGASYKMSCE